jgi:hypothetical protein
VHPVVAQLLLGFVSLRQRRQLLGIVEERFEPGIAVGSLKAGDQGFKRRHEHSASVLLARWHTHDFGAIPFLALEPGDQLTRSPLYPVSVPPPSRGSGIKDMISWRPWLSSFREM